MLKFIHWCNVIFTFSRPGGASLKSFSHGSTTEGSVVHLAVKTPQHKYSNSITPVIFLWVKTIESQKLTYWRVKLFQKKKKSLSFTEYWAVLTMKNDDDEAAERKWRHDKSFLWQRMFLCFFFAFSSEQLFPKLHLCPDGLFFYRLCLFWEKHSRWIHIVSHFLLLF